MEGCMRKYHTTSLDNLNVTLQTTTTLKLATLLLDSERGSNLQHYWLEITKFIAEDKIYWTTADRT